MAASSPPSDPQGTATTDYAPRAAAMIAIVRTAPSALATGSGA
jgi:hypothetical protein